VDGGFKAYKVGKHRHLPEIEQELNALAGKKFGYFFYTAFITGETRYFEHNLCDAEERYYFAEAAFPLFLVLREKKNLSGFVLPGFILIFLLCADRIIVISDWLLICEQKSDYNSGN